MDSIYLSTCCYKKNDLRIKQCSRALCNNLNRHIVFWVEHILLSHCFAGIPLCPYLEVHGGGILSSWDTLAFLNAAAGRMLPPPALQETSVGLRSCLTVLLPCWLDCGAMLNPRFPTQETTSPLPAPPKSAHPFPVPLLMKNLWRSQKKSFFEWILKPLELWLPFGAVNPWAWGWCYSHPRRYSAGSNPTAATHFSWILPLSR